MVVQGCEETHQLKIGCAGLRRGDASLGFLGREPRARLPC
jgi:hypothetical protein